ncbi:MAG: ROK family protein [Cenarchaeum symbiont of Oopsacas minuta]|nr:ROK family protein [Cenarchaeum symbiont of Oopsacas minuta]
MPHECVGIDFGGTKIEGVLISDSVITPVEKIRLQTPQNDYEKILETITYMIETLMKNSSRKCPVGICIPGNIQTGIIKNSNVQCLVGKNFVSDLKIRLNIKIITENDANCFALAESIAGAGVGYNTVFGATIGTGVGGGIVMNGNIYRGSTHTAGEWGHHIIHQDGRVCHCGKNGCVEAYISGNALEERWSNLTGNIKKPLKDIVRGDKVNKLWKSEFLHNFGIGLGNIAAILDPNVIVLGGGVSNVDFLYTEGVLEVHKLGLDGVKIPILKNKLGDSAGVYGACMLALKDDSV